MQCFDDFIWIRPAMNRNQKRDLDGQTAIVTGASRGLGASIAYGMCEAGMKVFGMARSSGSEITHTNFTYLPCDIANQDALKAAFETYRSTYYGLSCLVNAAGISLPQTDRLAYHDAFDKTLAINLGAAHQASQLAFEMMKPHKTGSIVNITSIGAWLGFPGNPAYVASKGALEAMTRALALDFGAYGVRVNNIVPGYFETAMTEKSFHDNTAFKQRADRTMLGRWGKSEELIGPTLFLASDDSSYVTGASLVVDGGWTAKGL